MRIAVTILNAQQMGREVTREQLLEHLDDLAPETIDDAVGRLKAEGLLHAHKLGLLPRPPPSASHGLPGVGGYGSRAPGATPARAGPAPGR